MTSRNRGALAALASGLVMLAPVTACTRSGGQVAVDPSPVGGVVAVIRDGEPAPAVGEAGPPVVEAEAETELFAGAEGDVADDSAIWRNESAPERSLILAGNKADDGGIAVYDLSGRQLHYESLGKIGNIDVLSDYRLGDRAVVLVGVNDRSDDTVRLWSLDPGTGRLSPVTAEAIPTVTPNYGFCLGRSADGDRAFAVVTQENGGRVEQYELVGDTGKVSARLVRTLELGTQSEGCAVDDARGVLYVAEEDVGIWRYPLDPAAGGDRTPVDQVGDGHLVADVEGVSLARGGDGDGVLVASSQGDSTFAVYDLDGGNSYLGSFQVRAGGTVDGVSETDGLAVHAGSFGPRYPGGLLVVHDGVNRHDDQDEPVSNLKLIRLDRVVSLAP